MGCDIHMYVERQVEDGSWVRIPDSEGPRHFYYDPKADKKHQSYFDKPEWDVGRNYMLFGLLAGVRNRQIEPIAEPKGVPDDMSTSTAEEWEQGQGDWHTPSYFSASELLAAKEKPAKFKGALDVSEYKAYLKTNKTKVPDYTYYSPPDGTTVVSNKEMEKIIGLTAFLNDGVSYYTNLEWFEPQESISEHLFNVIVPAILAIEPDPEKIRIVFWFDN